MRTYRCLAGCGKSLRSLLPFAYLAGCYSGRPTLLSQNPFFRILLAIQLAVLSVVLMAPLGVLAMPVQTRAVVAATPTHTPVRTPTPKSTATPTHTTVRTPTPKPTPTPGIATLSGTAVQGPMASTTVLVYAVNTANGSNGAILGGTLADGNGNFTIKLARPAGPVRLLADGGTYVSEMKGATIYTPADISALLGSVTGNVAGISINPLSNFVDSMTVGKLKAGGISFANALAAATANIEKFYGLTTDPARIIPNYTSSGLNTDAGNLGLILGALINEDQALCPDQPGGLVTALAADIADGVYNGLSFGNAITYCGKQKLTALAGTIDFQDASSGVAQLAHITGAFAFGGKGNILTANQLANGALNGTLVYPLVPLAKVNAAIVQTAPAPVNKFAPPAGTATMNQARELATGTLLPNGKVLIAGGVFGTAVFTSTELYNPATNTFAPASATARMNGARYWATATLLPSGKVLIAGGYAFGSALASTELYDPITNSFSPGTATMNIARLNATATLLPNGKVLIAGGEDSNFNPLPSTELYDPKTNTFTPSGATANMNAARVSTTADLLPNGKVLIAGGYQPSPVGSVPLASTELYDPASNTFAPAAATATMNLARDGAIAVMLPNGKLLIAGGFGSLGDLTSVELYDPGTNTFAPPTATPAMNNPHGNGVAKLLPNGKVLIAGDNGLPGEPGNTDLYNPATNSFASASVTVLMNANRINDTITLLPNGKVLIAGGVNQDSGTLSSTDLYTP